MGVVTTCPACQASFKVKDKLRGKRIRCRHCNNPVLVGDADDPVTEISGMETSTDIDVWDETQDSLPLSRMRFGGAEEPLPAQQGPGFWVWAAENPLVVLGIAFFGFWVPFSLVEPKLLLVTNIALAVLAAAGVATAVVLELLRIKYENPLDLINRATIGALAERFVPPEKWSLTKSAAIRRNSPTDAESMSPEGRRLASQCGIICAAMTVHAALLWVLRQQDIL